MTTLTLTVRGLNGSVIPNTSFKITAGYPDETYDPEIVMTSVVTFTTDNDGEATVTLTPGIAPYFLTRAAGMVDDVIAYKFYVPIGSTSLTLGLVYVDLKTQFKLLNDKSLYSLIEAKVAMLACLEQAKVSAAAANESKETTADYLATVETVIGVGITTHTEGVDPHGDRAYADSLVTGLWDDRGNFDASVNAYPSSGGSGTAGAINKGDIWTVTVEGVLPTAQVIKVGATVRALVDSPGQTQANWAIGQNNLGYVPENSTNKSTDGTMADNSTTKYPSQSAVVEYVGNQLLSYGSVDSRVDRDFEDFRNLGEAASHFAANMRARVSAMTITTPSNSMTLADISGAAGTSGWMRCYTGALGAGAIGYITEYFGYSPIAASASKEFVWAGSLDTLPTGTTTTDAVVRIGFGGYAANIQTNPVAQALASAYFQVDKGGYWKCFSGKTGATENTTTGVATAAMTYASLRIIVAATTGVVSFYINGTLVATHSGVGACPYEQQWYKFVSVYNQGAGTIATSSTSGPGAVFFDAWGSAIKLASDRANLRFLT